MSMTVAPAQPSSMVMASWPAARRRQGHSALTPAVRRRVAHALRLEVRNALRVAGPLVAVGVAADAIHLLLRYGVAGVPTAVVEAGGAALVVAVATIGRRAVRHPEIPAFAIPTMLVLLALVTGWMLPETYAISVAYIGIILVVTAVLVPWSPRWHVAWLMTALLLAAASLVLRAGAGGAREDEVAVLTTTVVAALASLVAHRIVHARQQRLLENQFRLRTLTRHSSRQETAVEELNRELVRIAREDTVTGIGNRRALDEALVSLAERRLAAILLDVDHFKVFNDRYGHLAGDAALARVGSLLRGAVRDGDLVYRYGGEEFLVLVPDADREAAAALAERLRAAIEERTAGDIGLTVSAGVAIADRFSSSSPLPLLRRADAALYRAKRTGRNRVAVDTTR